MQPVHFICSLVLICSFPWLSQCKMCTNGGVSHTLRSKYLAAVEYASSAATTSHSHSSGGGSRRMMRTGVYRSNTSSQFLEGASLHNVRLSSDSPFGVAQQTNLEYLLMLNVDNLVYSFRNVSGLNTSGSPYGGWESPNSELRGHFVGHYLSATALMWASTGNATVFQKMNEVLEALYACQENLGTGYLSAFPSSLFDRFEDLEPVWAPYYTVHKIMAGLLDQYTIAGSGLAFKMIQRMAHYFSKRIEAVIEKYSIERHWQSLNEETGGMNDVMYRLYMVTGNKNHLKLAHLFDKPCFLGPLAVKADSISGFHTNTHIPIVVGAQMRYEATNDKLYKYLTEYFMDIVSSSHTYATGGTSSGEFWTDPKMLGSTLGTENEESCTTYNMLKVARNLFRWTRDAKYADFYERALINGVLAIQRGREPGVMIYMLPLAAGSSKAKSYHGWGTPFSSFWCCYGTATESFSKLGDSIYFFDKQGTHLYAIQFVSSSTQWPALGLQVKQTIEQMTSLDPLLNATFEFIPTSTNGSHQGEATFFVRVPSWASTSDSRCALNDENIDIPPPGSFITITRAWKAGDRLLLSLKAMLRLEKIQDDRKEYSSLYAIYFGPYLLAGMSDGDNRLGPVNISSPSQWLLPASGKLFTFTTSSKGARVLVSRKDGGSAISLVSTPSRGTDEAAHATFKINVHDPSFRGTRSSSLVGTQISLELLRQPGSFVSHNGAHQRVTARHGTGSLFQVILGISGEPGTVSFEAQELPGCFLSAPDAGDDVILKCKPGNLSSNSSSSFRVSSRAAAAYHPMSFVATGINTTFLLFPLNAYTDEKYTVYFQTK